MPVRSVKLQARAMLRGHRLTLAGGMCMLMFMLLALGLCEYICKSLAGDFLRTSLMRAASDIFWLAVQYAVVSPLVCGMWRYLRLLADGRAVNAGSLFIFYSSHRRFWRAVSVFFTILLRKAAYLLLLFLPPAVLSFFISEQAADAFGYSPGGALYALFFALAAAMRICAVLIYVCVMLRYSLAGITASAEEGGVWRAVSGSARSVKGHKTYIFALALSFAGWFLLCVFVFPALFVLPYFWGCLAVYASSIPTQAPHANKASRRASRRGRRSAAQGAD